MYELIIYDSEPLEISITDEGFDIELTDDVIEIVSLESQGPAGPPGAGIDEGDFDGLVGGADFVTWYEMAKIN